MTGIVPVDEYWTKAELRRFLKLEGRGKDRTWYRLRPFFSGAVVQFPAAAHHTLYSVAKVRELLEGARSRTSPLRRSRVLRKVS